MAGDAAAPAQGADGGQQGNNDAQQQQGSFDPTQIQQQLETFGEGQAELRTLVQGLGEQFTQSQQPAEDAPEDIDLSQFLDPGIDPEQQSQQLQQIIDQRIADGVERALKEHVDPIREQQLEMRQQAELTQLVEEFPILGQDQEAARQLFETTATLAASNGWPAEVANDPALLRIVTMAAGFQRAMAEEKEANAGADAGAQLEQAGGAGPLGFGPDAAQQIVNAGTRRGAGALPF